MGSDVRILPATPQRRRALRRYRALYRGDRGVQERVADERAPRPALLALRAGVEQLDEPVDDGLQRVALRIADAAHDTSDDVGVAERVCQLVAGAEHVVNRVGDRGHPGRQCVRERHERLVVRRILHERVLRLRPYACISKDRLILRDSQLGERRPGFVLLEEPLRTSQEQEIVKHRHALIELLRRRAAPAHDPREHPRERVGQRSPHGRHCREARATHRVDGADTGIADGDAVHVKRRHVAYERESLGATFPLRRNIADAVQDKRKLVVSGLAQGCDGLREERICDLGVLRRP